jgi:glutamate-1-semialdehyde aminotransferase
LKRYENIHWNKRALESIAHGALTNSKRTASFVEGVYPSHIKSAFKCYVKDVDGNHYIDYICGLGTNLFGYANPDICRTVNQVLQTGSSVFSLGSTEEVELAEKIKEVFPFIDRMRFLKSGSEGCSAAVRMARAFTGRDFVVSEGYHGWHDGFVSLTPPARGIPPSCGYGLTSIKDFAPADDVAAVIIEPIITDMSDARIKWLTDLRELCTKKGIVLIFDETITAYRFPEYCVANYLNIYPDIWIGGKAIAGGLALSIVGGRKDVLESDYFVSSTWAGDRVGCAAGLEAVRLSHNDFRPEDLWVLGQEFTDKFNRVDEEVQLEGYPTRGVFKYKSDTFKALYMQELCKAGVLIGPSWFYNKYLHMEMDNVLSISKAAIKKIKEGSVKLEGNHPRSPFAEKVRKHA